MVHFIVVSFFSLYTVILSRSWIHAIRVVPSTLHVKVNFHTDHGVVVVRGDQQVARQCLVEAVNREIKQKEFAGQDPLQQLLEPPEGKGTDSAKDLIKVSILSYENERFYIGNSMKHEDRVNVLLLLVQNLEIFAQSPYDVLSMDPKFITHKLNVDPLFPPKKQKPRRSAKQHVEAMKQEVQRLKQAEAIREVYFPE